MRVNLHAFIIIVCVHIFQLSCVLLYAMFLISSQSYVTPMKFALLCVLFHAHVTAKYYYIEDEEQHCIVYSIVYSDTQ